MIDPSSFSPPIAKGDPPLTLSQVMRKLVKAADRVVAPLHQKQILFVDSPLKSPIGQAGAAVQVATLEINAFNHRLYAYRKALARLERYRKSDGIQEIVEQRPTGELDSETAEPIIEDVVIRQAIDPLPTTVKIDIHDPDTGELIRIDEIPNPAIVKDDNERAENQAIIDNTPQNVKDWFSNTTT